MVLVPPIVPQHSIRGVQVGMARSAVVRTLGKASNVIRGSSDQGPYTILVYRNFRVVFALGGGVSQVETTSARDRTSGGVGVGSTEAQVRAAFPRASCATSAGIRNCHLGRYRAGALVTDFFLRRGRVDRVVVGRVLD